MLTTDNEFYWFRLTPNYLVARSSITSVYHDRTGKKFIFGHSGGVTFEFSEKEGKAIARRLGVFLGAK